MSMPQIAERRMLNASKSATSSIPSEVLSMIFQEVIEPSYSFRKGDYNCSMRLKFKILSICSQWRQVACGAPAFWPDFTLSFVTLSELKKVGYILKLHLQLSGNLPLEIELYYNCMPSERPRFDTDNLVHSSIDADLIQHLPRVRSLRLMTLPFAMVENWLAHKSHLSGLQSLNIRTGSEGSHSVDLLDSPSLTDLVLDGMHDISVQPDSLRTLFLNLVSTDLCIKLLLECRNLRSFTVVNPRPVAPDDAISLPEEAVVLPNLEELSWVFMESEWDEYLLQHLSAPSLKFLLWNNPFGCSPEYETQNMESFCNRLPTSIEHVELVGLTEDMNMLKSFPKHLHIEQFFIECDSWEEAIKYAELLAGTYKGAGGRSTMRAFPKLTKLQITGVDDGGDLTDQAAQFVSFLETIYHRVEPGETFEVYFCGTTIDYARDSLPADVVIMVECGSLVLQDDQGRMNF
ncbi:hypothetical protein D9756_005717 [Leucocoprinus leucothites]|uniref:F-box domain-containing protein n=1 Tax=Leucocoprinus leucothites TaxID=201217 RepID=A0A8H5D9H0_9AGAR|nr:hypothetical protein D9756_005717 [Leucoagaricus leucothites]